MAIVSLWTSNQLAKSYALCRNVVVLIVVTCGQDAQEFSKLFMTLLEKDPAMRRFIQQQFMGKYEYLTWFMMVLFDGFVLIYCL